MSIFSLMIYQLGNLQSRDTHIGKNLTTKEQSNLDDLLEEFEDVLSIKPGKTDLIEHHIVTNTTELKKLRTTIQSATSLPGNGQTRNQRNVEPMNH